jgi:hypothetical protein
MKLPADVSQRALQLATSVEIDEWLAGAAKALGGVDWRPLGGIDNNVHTVEAASDPALALVERPINGIDALLDLRARERGETAPTPHAAAQRWWGVPTGGLGEMDERLRQQLASLLRVTMRESGDARRPTVVIQDGGTGQHPDDFSTTLLSLLASNKKSAKHQMGVYNAGGAASYRFARATVIVSRLAPQLLGGRADEVGVSVVRFDPLDPDRFKSGSYQYLTARDGAIIRLTMAELPDLPHGTQVRLIEYELSKYARAAQEPKSSLWHLFHAALPAPPLPLQIIETRSDRFPGVRGVERRTVAGLLRLLGRPGVANYADVRSIDLGPAVGHAELRYYVLNEGRDPDAYVTPDQGLTITLNGQRQVTRDRYWVKRNLDLPFLYRRLIIVVDGTQITSSAKRDIFSSTRETGVDTPAARELVERVLSELRDDEYLDGLDEQARQRVLADATKSTTTRVKRQLAAQIGAYMKGKLGGSKGGGPKGPSKPGRGGSPRPPEVDDSHLPEVPDTLSILTNPVRIHPGGTAALRLSLNAKNDFLPRHADGLSVVVGPELAQHVRLRAKGRLLGSQARLTLEAAPDAPELVSSVQVALVVPQLGLLLTASSAVEVAKPKQKENEDQRSGGEPDIEVRWVGREKWAGFDPPWDQRTVGVCDINRDPAQRETITRVEWVLNEGFSEYERAVSEKRLGEDALTKFRERFEYPVLLAMFQQRLAEEAKERQADEEGRRYEVPDDYVRGELARMARAVLMAMEPDFAIAGAADAA